VGDRWVFRRGGGGAGAPVVTHQVVAASPGGYTMRLAGPAPAVVREWTADLHLAAQTVEGGATARFDPPAMMFAWPLALGKTWTQTFEYRDGRRDGRYQNRWTADDGVVPVDVVAGLFYTLRIEHRSAEGRRLAAYWYSPRVRYWVRLESDLDGYAEELVEYRP
jgi:hypothetical protein